MFKLLVTGGRNYRDKARAFEILDWLHSEYKVTHLIHGGAKGADELAGMWARDRIITEIACPADWEKHGKAAGPIRNQAMLDQHSPDLVFAFPGGRGTANMCELAHKAGVTVLTLSRSSGEPAIESDQLGSEPGGRLF